MVEKNWVRDIFLIPLIVGLIVAIFQFGFPKLSEKNFELSYSAEEPKLVLDTDKMGYVKVKINDIETNLLYSQSIKFWNSGGIPIKSLPIRYVYDYGNISGPGFNNEFDTHNTKPEYEFGNITLIEDTPGSKKYLYDLLNPGDEFIITFYTNTKIPIKAYAKAEGLNVKKIEPPKEEARPYWLSIFAFIIGFSVAILESLLKKRYR